MGGSQEAVLKHKPPGRDKYLILRPLRGSSLGRPAGDGKAQIHE